MKDRKCNPYPMNLSIQKSDTLELKHFLSCPLDLPGCVLDNLSLQLIQISSLQVKNNFISKHENKSKIRDFCRKMKRPRMKETSKRAHRKSFTGQLQRLVLKTFPKTTKNKYNQPITTNSHRK